MNEQHYVWPNNFGTMHSLSSWWSKKFLCQSQKYLKWNNCNVYRTWHWCMTLVQYKINSLKYCEKKVKKIEGTMVFHIMWLSPHSSIFSLQPSENHSFTQLFFPSLLHSCLCPDPDGVRTSHFSSNNVSS